MSGGEALTDAFVAFDKIPTLRLVPATKDQKAGDRSVCVFCGDIFTATAWRQKFCDSRCSYRHWAANNRDRANASARSYRRRRYESDGRWADSGPKATALKQWMVELKSQPCTDCKQSFDACCMDFDHRDGSTKSFNVGSMFAHHYSRELIEREIEKCDLVCANCHRVRTRDRRTGSALPKVTLENDGQPKSKAVSQ